MCKKKKRVHLGAVGNEARVSSVRFVHPKYDNVMCGFDGSVYVRPKNKDQYEKLQGAKENNYHRVSFHYEGKQIRKPAHVLVWETCHQALVPEVEYKKLDGTWKKEPAHIDHINRKRNDNRCANLRLALPSQNGRNKLTNMICHYLDDTYENSGLKFIRKKSKTGPWVCEITIHDVVFYLGSSRDKSILARQADEFFEGLFGDFAHTNHKEGLLEEQEDDFFI